MEIAIIGTGYVGLVTGTCFAEMGNHVICTDIDADKIAKLQNSDSPLYEPSLNELIRRNAGEGRLKFTTDTRTAIKKSDVVFNCVGTPLDKKELPDLKNTYKVAEQFGSCLNGYKIFVNKSTVPVGTTARCKKIILKQMGNSPRKRTSAGFDVISNPEFLRQGTAVKDFMTPDRIIIGGEKKRALKIMEKLYEPIIRAGKPLIQTDIKTAELIKYAANAFIATKISFINEMAAFCEKSGVNIREVAKAVGLDGRIGPRYLHAGIGFGGGCLSKDIKSLIAIGEKHGHEFRLLKNVSSINTNQRQLLIKKITGNINLRNKTIAVWGLSYKPKTDDLRDSPAVDIINSLYQNGALLNLFDPVANANAKKILPSGPKIKYFNKSLDAVKGADALVILTEWDEFRATDFNRLKKLMKGNFIFDGRNIFHASETKKAGFRYFGIGSK